jgi:hypothetical protein
MKSNIFIFLVSIASLVTVVSCVEPYAPPEIAGDPDLIVIDAYLNGTDNSCHARITKAVPLLSETGFEEITDPMTVSLEDEQGTQFSLYRIANGQYDAVSLPLDHSRKYRLVAEIAGEKYLSDFVEIVQTPPIEKIFFEPTNEELQILVNTASASGGSSYYRWSWVETFEYTSPHNSSYKMSGDTAIPRTQEEFIYRCYKTSPSTNIMIASSSELSSDVIRNFQIQTVPRSSQKLQYRYSINVRQMALTEDAYTYWLNLFKTTENVGGLFDPMPGEVIGNFTKESDISARVIGYFSAATTHEERIFIAKADLPENYGTYRAPFCPLDTIMLDELVSVGSSVLLVSPLYSDGFPTLIGFSGSPQDCVDCRIIHGGVTEKPPFWP